MATLIGSFKAKQQRERVLRRNKYSHFVFVFDEGLLLVEARPLRDAAAAAINFVPGVGHIPGIGHYVTLAKHLLRLGSSYGRVDAETAKLAQVTPETIIAAFPGHVRGLGAAQITSAVLRRTPPELRVKYDDGGAENQLWLKLPLTQSVEPVAEVMTALIGPRLTRASVGGGLLDTALDLLPG